MPKKQKTFSQIARETAARQYQSDGRELTVLSTRQVPQIMDDIMKRWVELENGSRGLSAKSGYNRHDAIYMALLHGIEAMAARVEVLEEELKAEQARLDSLKTTELAEA